MFGDPIDPGTLCDTELELILIDFGMHSVHKVPAYHFSILHRGSAAEVGKIRLRIGSTAHIERYAGHVGYEVHAAHRGNGYAARALQLLVPFAKQQEIDPLWITCDPENIASRRTLEKVGAEFVEIVDVPEDCIIFQSGHARKCRFRLATA